MTFDEVMLRPALVPVAPPAMPTRPDPVYLLVGQGEMVKGRATYTSSMLTPGAKAAVLTETKVVKQQDLKATSKGSRLAR